MKIVGIREMRHQPLYDTLAPLKGWARLYYGARRLVRYSPPGRLWRWLFPNGTWRWSVCFWCQDGEHYDCDDDDLPCPCRRRNHQ
jgi:hypothetical protein